MQPLEEETVWIGSELLGIHMEAFGAFSSVYFMSFDGN